MGHKLVAQIAYDEMTPKAKQFYEGLFHQGHDRSFMNTAVWLDEIRSRHDPYYNEMHYIDIPFSEDGSTLPPVAPHNAVSAINHAVSILSTPTQSAAHKKEAVRILLHVVGDIHQPLHAATRVSQAHKEGDRGGNDERLSQHAWAGNLHQYWDKGAGILACKKHRKLSIKTMSKRLEQQYPCAITRELNPMAWAEESHLLAKRVAYAYSSWRGLDKSYQHNAQRTVQQRIAQAGCRLAGLMNHIAEVS